MYKLKLTKSTIFHYLYLSIYFAHALCANPFGRCEIQNPKSKLQTAKSKILPNERSTVRWLYERCTNEWTDYERTNPPNGP